MSQGVRETWAVVEDNAIMENYAIFTSFKTSFNHIILIKNDSKLVKV